MIAIQLKLMFMYSITSLTRTIQTMNTAVCSIDWTDYYLPVYQPMNGLSGGDGVKRKLRAKRAVQSLRERDRGDQPEQFAVSLQIQFHDQRKVASAKSGHQSNLLTISDLTNNWSLHQNLVHGMAASKECLSGSRGLLRLQFSFYPIPTAGPIHSLATSLSINKSPGY